MIRVKREDFNLIGPVRIVDSTFSYFELVDGIHKENRTEPADYLLFDSEGRLLEERSSERDLVDQIYEEIFTYDDDGNLAARDEYDRTGRHSGQSKFELDSEGNLIERHFNISANGNPIISSKIIHGPDDQFRVQHFDIHGDPVEYPTGIMSPPRRTEITKKETAEGFLMEERKFDEKGLVDFRIVTHYDRRGLELDFSTYEPNGEISIRQEYEYEFDAAGNWTTQFVSRWVVGWGEFKMTPSMVTRRTIEYF